MHLSHLLLPRMDASSCVVGTVVNGQGIITGVFLTFKKKGGVGSGKGQVGGMFLSCWEGDAQSS